jgi:bacteriorhodopsin
LFAAFSHHKVQWGYYAISCVFYLYIVFTLVISARRASIARGARVGQLFTSISLYTIVIWTLYPIVWALGEGTQKVSVDTEIYLYAVVRPNFRSFLCADYELDILAKGIFGGWLLVAHLRIQEGHVPLTGWWIEGSGALDATDAERRRLLDED